MVGNDMSGDNRDERGTGRRNTGRARSSKASQGPYRPAAAEKKLAAAPGVAIADEDGAPEAAASATARPRRPRSVAARHTTGRGARDESPRGLSPRRPAGISEAEDPPGRPGAAVSEQARLGDGEPSRSIDSCQYFEELLQRVDELSDDEMEVLLFHEDFCPSQRHTPAALEADLGLPPGALTHGSAEHGLASQEERHTWMRGILAIEPYLSSPEFERDFGPAALQEEAAGAQDDEQLSESPSRPCGVRIVTGSQMAHWTSLPHGEGRQDGLVLLTRLDGGLAAEFVRPPSCMVALWRFVPYWKSFISLACEKMSFFLLNGEVEWEDAFSHKTLRLSMGGSANNFVSSCSPSVAARSAPPGHLPPFRARQVGHGQAVGLAVFYASNGLRFTTAPNGRSICFDVQEWTADRLEGDMEKLRKSAALRPPVVSRIPRSEAELARSVLPLYEDHPFDIRLVRYDPGGKPATPSAAGASTLEVLVPLVGSVDLFWVEASPVRDISPGKPESLEPVVRLHEQARSASASNEGYPDVALLRGPAPISVRSLGDDGAVCLSVRVPQSAEGSHLT
jgi:hypothetical protein